MGYSLCKMADIQNRLIPRIFGVLSSGFLHRTTLMFLENCFLHVLAFLIFDPNCSFCKVYSLFKMADI